MSDRFPTYDELCDELLEHLRSHAGDLELTADDIREGVLGQLPDWPSPYIAVYIDPVDSEQTASGAAAYNVAAVTLLISASSESTQADALRAAVRLAARAYVVMQPVIDFDKRSLQRFTDIGMSAKVTLQATAPFTLLE